MRTKYKIDYGSKIARFSDKIDARIFGAFMSCNGQLVELSDKSGLIGQWLNGEETPEFEGLK